MNNIEELKDYVEDFSENPHPIVCRYIRSQIMSNVDFPFVQVILEPVSDEPTFVDIYKEFFGGNEVHPNNYYLRAETFRDVIEDSNFTDLTLDDQKKEMDERFEGRLVIINPKFTFNQEKNIFYKNGWTPKDYNGKIHDEGESYLLVPVMESREDCLNLLAHKDFSLPMISGRSLVTPEYLYFNSVIYVVSLKVDGEGFYCQKEGVQCKSIKIDLDEMKEEKKILLTDEEGKEKFIFLRKDALKDLLRTYRSNSTVGKIKTSNEKEILSNFQEYAQKNRLFYSLDDIENFHSCVKSSNLTIIAGMSGTGKTRLPLLYSDFFNMSEKKENLLFVPISPSYLEPSDILGYLDKDHHYVASETGLVPFLIHASQNKDTMHAVIFDEMNLAPIEYYFAPFLSILERKEGDRFLRLYGDEQKEDAKIPSIIPIYDNVRFIGTVNLDDTTKNLSDRLLDRAFVVKLTKESFVDSYERMEEENNAPVLGESSSKHYAKDLLTLIKKVDGDNFLSKLSLDEVKFLEEAHQAVNNVDGEKGLSFREVKQISLYLENSTDFFDCQKAFDYALLQTFLRKINGSSEVLKDILGEYDHDKKRVVNSLLLKVMDDYQSISSFERCRKEIENKVKQLNLYGFVK